LDSRAQHGTLLASEQKWVWWVPPMLISGKTSEIFKGEDRMKETEKEAVM